ncbi:hypothetical protein D3C87_1803800 [compost metagenome]
MLFPLPLFVVIKITPALALEPYSAEAAAPFKTEMLSISSGFRFPTASPRSGALSHWLPELPFGLVLFKPTGLFSIGTPLITYNGWLVWLKLDTPRMSTLDAAPGPPEVELISKPATLPTNELATLFSLAWVKVSP